MNVCQLCQVAITNGSLCEGCRQRQRTRQACDEMMAKLADLKALMDATAQANERLRQQVEALCGLPQETT